MSVIVPTFNRPALLRRALSSVLDQTFTDYEIVVANDAGVDVSDVIREVEGRCRIQYIVHPKNRGLAAARNTALSRATGEFIAYLDDDDIYYPDHLDTLVRFVKDHGAAFAYTDALQATYTVCNGRRRIKDRRLVYSEEFDGDLLLVRNLFPVLTVLHNRQCLELGGTFDESLSRHEDWDLWIRMARDCPPRHIRRTTAEYSMLTDGTTMTSGPVGPFFDTMKAIHIRYSHLAQDVQRVKLLQDQRVKELQTVVAAANRSASMRMALRTVGGARSFVSHYVLDARGRRLMRDIVYILNRANLLSHHEVCEQVRREVSAWLDEPFLPLTVEQLRKREDVAELMARQSSVARRIHETECAELAGVCRFHVFVVSYNGDATAVEQTLDSLKDQYLTEWSATVVTPLDCSQRLNQIVREHAQHVVLTPVQSREELEMQFGRVVAPLMAGVGGAYCLLLRAGDQLAPEAFLETAKRLKEDPDSACVVWDEDHQCVDYISEPIWKPPFSRILTESGFDWGRGVLFRGDIVRETALLCFTGESTLRHAVLLDLLAHDAAVVQIHRRLVRANVWNGNWPLHRPARLDGVERQVAIENYLSARGEKCSVTVGAYPGSFRVRHNLTATPLVSIIIPSKAGREDAVDLRRCVQSIVAKSTYRALELVVVPDGDSGAIDAATQEVLRVVPHRIRPYKEPFNFSAKCNEGAKVASGEYLIFLNEDMEVITPDWIECMLAYATRPGVGVVGAKLFYPGGGIQHAGVVFFRTGYYGAHVHRMVQSPDRGYLSLVEMPSNVGAVTGACLMTPAKVFSTLGRFDERFALVCNDIDYCLRAHRSNMDVVYTPHAEMLHYEGVGRHGATTSKLKDESEFLRMWGSFLTANRRIVATDDSTSPEDLRRIIEKYHFF